MLFCPRKSAFSSLNTQIIKNVFSHFATKSAASSLARLRKATGHPFGFCREALAACDDDYSRALAWLQEEATKRGMAKAEKLKSRPMSQGLLGMIASPRCVAAVEVNCETDFVARNQDFQSLVASSTESLFRRLSVSWYPMNSERSNQVLQFRSFRRKPMSRGLTYTLRKNSKLFLLMALNRKRSVRYWQRWLAHLERIWLFLEELGWLCREIKSMILVISLPIAIWVMLESRGEFEMLFSANTSPSCAIATLTIR